MSTGEGGPGPLPVLWNPVGTLQGVAAERRALPGLAVVAAHAGLGLLLSAAFVLGGPGFPPGFEEDLTRAVEIGAPVLALLYPFLIWLSVSFCMHLATRLFGGAGPLSSMLGVVGVAQVPLLAGGALGALLGGLQLLAGAGTAVGAALGYLISLLSFASTLWHVALVVVGASLARGVGYGESAGSCALSCLGLGILIILLLVLAGVGVFTVVGASPR